MPPIQDIINQATGGQDGPMSYNVQGPVQPTAPVAPTPSSEPAIISSSQGASVVDKANQQLTALEGMPEETQTTETSTETPAAPETPKEEVNQDYVTYINPQTGAEKTLRGDAINDAARSSLENSGWTISEESTSQSRSKEKNAMKDAQQQLDDAVKQLESTAITSNELRRSVSNIKRRYTARMREMEALNRRREQTLSTLGVRLGSRYAGGVFGGIIAEEERQGIERVAKIEGEMLDAIDKAKKAAKEHNYSVFVKLTEKAQEKYDEKKQAFDDLQKIQAEKDAEIKEEANLVANQSAVIEQIQSGIKTPADIFAALGGTVPFDVIKEITDTLPETGTEQFTLGRYDIRYDSAGKVIARGSDAGGGGSGDTDMSGVSSFGSPSVIVGAPVVPGIGNSYKSSTAEAQMLIDDILNKIPVQLRNTEVETELKKEQIRKQLAAGYTYQQIVDRLSGFSLQGDRADKPLGEALYNAALGTDIDLGQLASLINRGAGEQAMTLVENKQLENVQGFFTTVDKTRSTIKQAQTVLNLLNDPAFPKDALGAFDGRVFKVQRFTGLNDAQRAKVQQLETALQLLASPIRVEVAGTAATDSEMAKISAFQSDILDQPDTIKVQVQSLIDAVAGFHNQARSQRGLPTVTEEQLLDNKARLQLYRELGGVNEEMVMSGMDNSSFLNSFSGFTPAKTDTSDNKSFFGNI